MASGSCSTPTGKRLREDGGRARAGRGDNRTPDAKSLAHAHRLELLKQLAQGERSVEALAERTGLSVANASQHLRQMRRAGIVATRREGKFIFCTLADEAVLDLMSALRRIAEQNIAEVERVP
jgi:DNA-binding transcriptional ArsR family regulator